MARSKEEATEENVTAKGTKYVVLKPFKDHPKYVKEGEIALSYQPGQEVTGFDPDRLEVLVKRGLVEKK